MLAAVLAGANEPDPLDTELADWGTWALFMSGETQAASDQGADLVDPSQPTRPAHETLN
jgi:hypothetical protein